MPSSKETLEHKLKRQLELLEKDKERRFDELAINLRNIIGLVDSFNWYTENLEDIKSRPYNNHSGYNTLEQNAISLTTLSIKFSNIVSKLTTTASKIEQIKKVLE